MSAIDDVPEAVWEGPLHGLIVHLDESLPDCLLCQDTCVMGPNLVCVCVGMAMDEVRKAVKIAGGYDWIGKSALQNMDLSFGGIDFGKGSSTFEIYTVKDDGTIAPLGTPPIWDEAAAIDWTTLQQEIKKATDYMLGKEPNDGQQTEGDQGPNEGGTPNPGEGPGGGLGPGDVHGDGHEEPRDDG